MRARYIGPVVMALALTGCQDAPMGLPGFAKAEKPAPVDAAPALPAQELSDVSGDTEVADASTASDVAAAEELQIAEAAETSEQSGPVAGGGVFGLLRGVLGTGGEAEAGAEQGVEPVPVELELAANDATDAAGEAISETPMETSVRAEGRDVAALSGASLEAAGSDQANPSPAPVRRAGLFGLLGIVGAEPAKEQDLTATGNAPTQAQRAVLQTASLITEPVDVEGAGGVLEQSSDAAAPQDLVEPAKRRGLLGGLFLGRAGAAASGVEEGSAPAQSKTVAAGGASRASEPELSPGAPLAFGTVGRVCKVSRSQRGKQVDRFPKRPRAGGYALYDSAPGATEMRSFYITGFKDGCARMVTAANVVFGAPSTYERLRYGLPSETLRKSATDAAYKRLKSKVCNVRRNQPCGPAITKLERDTVFVTLYDTFEGSKTWSNVLLHGGDVYARDVRPAR